MAMIETNHTLSAIDRIKKDLRRFMTVVSVISMLIFSAYYAWLIYLNINSVIYCAIYAILFLCVIFSFVVEMSLKQKKHKSRKDNRTQLEKKRMLNFWIKVFKYLAKSSTICIVIYEFIMKPEINMSIILNVVLAVVLVIQLLFELITHFINKYIDFLTLGLKLDKDNSSMIKFLYKVINKKQAKIDELEEELYALEEKALYTKQEEKIISILKHDAEQRKQNHECDLNAKLKDVKSKIKELKKQQKQKEKLKNINNKQVVNF